VEHPNVVRVHDTGTLEGRPCILLQLVEGQTFADLEPGVDWRVKVSLAAQAARGLGAAHRMGLIHRDVKPANILVEETPEGLQALLSDFGLARDEEGGLTRSGLMMGSVDYMAPEQVTGAAPVDFRADIYGLGATLYAVLAGRPPFRNTPGPTAAGASTDGLHDPTLEGDLHPGDLLRRVLEEEPRSLHSEVPGLPRDLGIVVAKAMEKEPAQRYITAEALADDLERVLRGEAIMARPMGWMEAGARWIHRNPLAARAVGVGLIAVLAATGFAAWNSRRSTLAALDASQMGAEAKALELRLRMAHLAPAHDLRPMKAQLRQGLVRLLGRRGAAGPASSFARGQVFLLLDELEDAQKALEQAQGAGYRGADLEEALGFVYGRRFVRALPAVEALKDPALKAQRREALQKTFKAPAIAHLGAAGNVLHQQAFIALLDKRYEEARALARRSRAEDPERLDSTLLEVEAWQLEAQEAHVRLDRIREGICLQEGLRLGEALFKDLRSNPEVPLLMARLKVIEAGTEQQLGRPAQKPFEEGIAWVDRALALDPEWADPWKVRGNLFEVMGQEAVIFGTLKGIAFAEQQVEACRKAVALRPSDAEALRALARGLHILGISKGQQQQDPLPCFLEGRKAALASEQFEGWHPSGPHLATINALDEASYLAPRGLDASEPLAAAEALVVRLKVTPGLLPAYLHRAIADLRGLQAMQAAGKGQDPDPLRAEAQAEYEALFKLEPDQLVRTSDVCFGAVNWAQGRVTMGRPVGEILTRANPILEAGLRRWPNQPMLLYYRAWLLGLHLYDRAGGSRVAEDPVRCAEALAAFEQAKVAMKNPSVMEIQAWMHLAMAESGRAGAAESARADFQKECERDPANPSPRLGLARALRVRGRKGDLDAAWGQLEGLDAGTKADPEVMLVRAVILADLGRAAEAAPLKATALTHQPLLAGHPVLAPRPSRK
jgi:serine/threonine-protein kinase